MYFLYLILAILVLLVMLPIVVLLVMVTIVVKLTLLTIQYKQLFPICFLYGEKMVHNCSWLFRT